MAIVKMKKLRVTAIRSQKEDLLKRLLMLGCVEVSEPDELLGDPELAELVSRENVETEALRIAHGSILRAQDIIKRYAPVKTPMFISRTDVSAEEFLCEDNLDDCLDVAAKLESLDSQIRYSNAEEGRERSLIESLLPWAPLDLPLDHDGTKTSSVLLGSVPLGTDFFELERAVSDAAEESNTAIVSSDESQQYLCIIYLREKLDAISEVLREYGFTASAPRNISTPALEEIDKTERRIKLLLENREHMNEELISLANEKRDSLRRCLDLITTKIARAEAEEKFLATTSSVTFTGWVPEESSEDIQKLLSEYDCVWELLDPVPEEYPNVPVKLKNNAFSAPLMMVTDMYSLPAYNGVDPNPLMAPFFILFYGMMMADMGYGLVMILVGLIVKLKKLRDGAMKQLFDLMFLCGISTFVIGVFSGGFFGDSLTQIAGMFGKEFELWYAFNTVEHAVYILVAAFALGLIHIIAGMAINLVHKIKTGKALDGILEVVPWWIVFAGIAFGALGVTWIVLIVGFVLVFLAGGRSSPKIMGKIAGGFSALYDVTGYFGDILSYARLMALMLAGGVIANVFNTVGALTGNIVTFLLIFVVGHALNFGINLLGCYVHDLRLQCLEFFGKFYEDGGKPFRPLVINSKYEKIVK